MKRRALLLLLLFLAFLLGIVVPVLALTPLGPQVAASVGLSTPTPTPSPTPIPPTPTPTPPPTPVLTVQGSPPTISAGAGYLLDMDTGHVLAHLNAQKPLPMASTTKIMTALIAIQTGDLNQTITVKQDAINQVREFNGSNANLNVGDRLTLKDLLYGLLLPSGDDAAIAIADGLAGSKENFVSRMNLFAYRLRLFQTHFTNPDGLTPDGETNPDHYTTAADLTRLAEYAMNIPLFATIVQTQSYTLSQTAEHPTYHWTNTNRLLTTYTGMDGIKTGHTMEAGYCLVFSAVRNQHHLIGVVLNSPSEEQRNQDVESWLNWAFALPVLPPSP